MPLIIRLSKSGQWLVTRKVDYEIYTVSNNVGISWITDGCFFLSVASYKTKQFFVGYAISVPKTGGFRRLGFNGISCKGKL